MADGDVIKMSKEAAAFDVHGDSGHNESNNQNGEVHNSEEMNDAPISEVNNDIEIETPKKTSSITDDLTDEDGWLQVLGNDQIRKKVIKSGTLDDRPTRGDVCTIRLEMKLRDEQTSFESHDSLTMQLGDAEVIAGIDLTIPLMCRGETALVQINHRFAYGKKGLPGVVPPNAAIDVEIELLNFEKEKDLEDLSITERKSIGNRKRQRGNWWYERDEPSLAVQCYRRAIEFFDETEGGMNYPKDSETDKEAVSAELKELMEDRLKTYNNLAAAQLKLEAYGPALTSVDTVLRCQPTNMKALFRKAKILSKKGETESALAVLKKCNELEPTNVQVTKEIKLLSAKKKVEQQSEKLLYKRMFNDSKKSETSSSSSRKPSYSVGIALGGLVVALAGVMAYRYKFL